MQKKRNKLSEKKSSTQRKPKFTLITKEIKKKGKEEVEENLSMSDEDTGSINSFGIDEELMGLEVDSTTGNNKFKNFLESSDDSSEERLRKQSMTLKEKKKRKRESLYENRKKIKYTMESERFDFKC